MLYIVATPIGNLEDLSARAERILREADLVLAEDTRQSSKILAHLGIEKKIISFHEHSDDKKLDWVIQELDKGKKVAYLTDAGTPNLSDPGGKLVEKAMAWGVQVAPIPGPSALTALISIAPFSCQNFLFLGYFPKKKGREKMTKYISSQEFPVFFFESPFRIDKTINFLAERLCGYKILIGRELTKKFEEVIFCDLTDKETLEKIISKGEFVFALVKL
jgi:16S rRNA (cytidine1402-2'-O)-methyltransferase